MTESTKTGRKYDFKSIEAKWQERWEKDHLYRATDSPDPKNKFYMLEMFAYPSGDIHMGHFRNYIIGDAVARREMMLGKAVLHPYGWDAFGLPAERAAIQRGIHPEVWTTKNIQVSNRTLQKVGISYDWSREIQSCRPDYYKWTQWMFIQLLDNGLAYRKRGFVNWCPEDKTVLANEQVKDGKCERCGTDVEKKDQVQWYFKITAYADRLIDDLDTLPGWPENVKTMQREWIGRSHGLEIDFTVEGSGERLPVFTTRADTIFGVTFMAISPESEILNSLALTAERREAVLDYCRLASRRSEIERTALTREKDGVFTGLFAVNPFNGARVQLWVADYVLAGYGTGVVMGVPAHDDRDFAFAKKYEIGVNVVIHPDTHTTLNGKTMAGAFVEYGPMVNSGQFDGLSGEKAIEAVSRHAEVQGYGRVRVHYKLKDWSISRQRYWGCPIPVIHCEKCGEVPVPIKDLPVLLPHTDNYVPRGRSPLADVPDYMSTVCPKCGSPAQRDPDTMDTFVCSSWYFLRYIDPSNSEEPFSKEKVGRWMPIDLYVGGITHATGHLIYFRFFTKFLKDIGWLTVDEPATSLFNLGMVMDSKGEVMSKSKGNVVSPIVLMDERGIDVTRLAMFFTAPSDKEVLWNSEGITGVEKFVLNRLYPLVGRFQNSGPDLKRHFKQDELTPSDREIYVKLNQTVKRVSESFERFQFNTVISALMELVRDFEHTQITEAELGDQIVLKVIQMIAPLAPHLAEELWHVAGNPESVFKSSWPVHDHSAVLGDMIEIAVQVNGKLRDTLTVSVEVTEENLIGAALKSARVLSFTDGKKIVKTIYIKGRLLNVVVTG